MTIEDKEKNTQPEQTATPEAEPAAAPEKEQTSAPQTEQSAQSDEPKEEKKDRKQARKEAKEAKKAEQSKPAEKPAEPAPQPQDTERYLRLLAEYDNYRKRSQKEKDNLYTDIKADTVTKFLPVYDNLARALAQHTDDEAYRKGVEMIMTQFVSTMEKLGVTEIKALGEKFNPEFHNAVMHVDDEEKGENEIVEVFQQGFMIGDKVIRFAMVKVAN